MYWNDWHMGGMWMWWFIILVIGTIVTVAAIIATRRSSRPSDETLEYLLKQRYAKGELDRETYERMLEDIRR